MFTHSKIAARLSTRICFTLKRCYSNYTTENNIIIIGNGPTGLAHALESLKHNNKLIMIYDRHHFTRPQVLSLRQESYDYITRLVGQDITKMYLKQDKIGTIEVGDKTRYLIQIKELETLFFEKMLAIQSNNLRMLHLDRRASSMSLDQSLRQIKINSPYEVIGFKYLIAADGARHDTLNLLTTSQVSFNQVQITEQIHTRHVTLSYTLPAELYQSAKLNYKKADNIPTIDELKKAGWELYSTPENRVFLVNNILYVGTEFPCPLNASKDSIDTWVSRILRFHFPHEIVKHIESDNLAKEYTSFDIRLTQASKHLFILPPGPLRSEKDWSILSGVGDGVRSPHYHSGSGAQLGLEQADMFGKFLESNQKLSDVVTYNHDVSTLFNVNRYSVDLFLFNRMIREQRAKESKIASKVEPNKLSFCPKL